MASSDPPPSEQDPVRDKKNNQGQHECEIFGWPEGPELEESHYAWGSCNKNPSHAPFIPAGEFCLDHLPAGSRHASVLSLVQNISARTVKLRVGYTSHRRPDGYAFSKHRGSTTVHAGSGCVHCFDHVPGPCPCPDCAAGRSPASPRLQAWYKVGVRTACHVVYDSEEAKSTRVDLFYDDEKAAADGRMKSLWGLEVGHKDIDGDRCTLICATHDQDLAARLKGFLGFAEWKDSHMECDDDFCVIVSHPHGQPKKITVGRIETKGSAFTPGRFTYGPRMSYSTATCAGSSGAAVLVLSRDCSPWGDGPHSLGGVEGGLNKSGACFYIPW